MTRHENARGDRAETVVPMETRLATRIAVEGAIDSIVGRQNPYGRRSNPHAWTLWESGAADAAEFLDLLAAIRAPKVPCWSLDRVVELLRETTTAPASEREQGS